MRPETAAIVAERVDHTVAAAMVVSQGSVAVVREAVAAGAMRP